MNQLLNNPKVTYTIVEFEVTQFHENDVVYQWTNYLWCGTREWGQLPPRGVSVSKNRLRVTDNDTYAVIYANAVSNTPTMPTVIEVELAYHQPRDVFAGFETTILGLVNVKMWDTVAKTFTFLTLWSSYYDDDGVVQIGFEGLIDDATLLALAHK